MLDSQKSICAKMSSFTITVNLNIFTSFKLVTLCSGRIVFILTDDSWRFAQARVGATSPVVTIT